MRNNIKDHPKLYNSYLSIYSNEKLNYRLKILKIILAQCYTNLISYEDLYIGHIIKERAVPYTCLKKVGEHMYVDYLSSDPTIYVDYKEEKLYGNFTDRVHIYTNIGSSIPTFFITSNKGVSKTLAKRAVKHWDSLD